MMKIQHLRTACKGKSEKQTRNLREMPTANLSEAKQRHWSDAGWDLCARANPDIKHDLDVVKSQLSTTGLTAQCTSSKAPTTAILDVETRHGHGIAHDGFWRSSSGRGPCPSGPVDKTSGMRGSCQLPRRAGARNGFQAITDDQHAGHQLRINRRPPRIAV